MVNNTGNSSSSDASDRVGARPRHAFTETNTSMEARVSNSTEGDQDDGLVGILARRSEDDGLQLQQRILSEDLEDDEEHRPLSPHEAILASENNVMGSILRPDDAAAAAAVAAPSIAIVTTEPSTETDDPSSSLLQKNITHALPRRTLSMEENNDANEGFSNEHQDNNENEDTKSEDDTERIDLTISPYDYDTNWDMIGHRASEEEQNEGENDNEEQQEAPDLLNRSGASLLAEAAAATAMLATTAAAAPSIESPPQSGNSLQGIAPQRPSSQYDYNVNWDMVGRPSETTAASVEQFHDDDNIVEEKNEETSPLHAASGCSSLAEAAAVTAMLKSKATEPKNATDDHPLQQSQENNEEDPLQQAVPLGGRSRSTPSPRMFSRPARPSRRMHDAHYYYNYRQHRSQSDVREEQQAVVNRRSTSADNLQSLHAVANEHCRDNAHISFDEFVNPTTETRSEMNESINTSTTSSSEGGSTRRRRSRRFQSTSWSSPFGSASSVRSRTSSVGRPASVNSAPAALAPTSPADNNNANSSRLRASLDSGMASVRRWIRSRGTGQQGGPRSSRAARRLQREHSDTLQLGEEDIFALANAGEDPRGMVRHHDDSSFTVIQQPSSMYIRSAIEYPPMIEEEIDESPRQRSLSEPDGNRLRNFFFERAATGTPTRIGFRRRRSSTAAAEPPEAAANSSGMSATSAHLQTAALSSSLFHSPQRSSSWSVEMTSLGDQQNDASAAPSVTSGTAGNTGTPTEGDEVPPTQELSDNDSVDDQEQADPDPNRDARSRWIRINRRFQLIITMVALVFSLLLFAILVCWVVLTSAYVVSIDKKCDVPLKTYFWLATLQLILDVFRTDIMRVIFRWDTNSNERIPARVIVYNIVYLTYAMLVLRLGIRSVFLDDTSTCPDTAPELFQSSTVFVVLSISAWSIIVLGYLVPFCFVAMLLTWNGYTPQTDRDMAEGGAGVAAMGAFGGVFPAAYSNGGAPPGCIDQLRVVMLEEFPEDYPQECCICMGDFCPGEVIVATACEHVFHKRCCQEWLRQARTCPVCRTDIPSSIGGGEDAAQPDEPRPAQPRVHRRIGPPFPGNAGHTFGREDFHQEVVNLFRILRQHEERLRQRNSNAAENAANNSDEEIGSIVEDEQNGSTSRVSVIESQQSRSEINVSDTIELEEGRFSR